MSDNDKRKRSGRLGLLDFLRDPQAQDDMKRRALALAKSGARGFTTGLLGMPVDIANAMMAGRGGEKPVMGGEWIGDKLEGAGLLAPRPRDGGQTLADLAGGLLNPGAGAKAAMAIKPGLAAIMAFHGNNPSGLLKYGDMNKVAELKNQLLADYAAAKANDPFSYFGVRVFHGDKKTSIGDTLNNSSKWANGAPLKTKLPGTAVFELRSSRDAENAIRQALAYNPGTAGIKLGIVRGNELASHNMPEGWAALIKNPK